MLLVLGTASPDVFIEKTRPMLYRKFKDAEAVHNAMLELLRSESQLLKPFEKLYRPTPRLEISIRNIRLTPFGIAAGFDKDASALLPLSYFFGFLEPGTVTLGPRTGNPKPRVFADPSRLAAFNAQGFPSGGLAAFKANLQAYRDLGGKKPVFANICGLPIPNLDNAFEELEVIVKELNGLVEGFVWNPASPNTESLKQLRNKDVFAETAKLLRKRAGDKIRLVKMWPYESEERESFMQLLRSFIDNGGDGTVLVNTKQVPRNEVPALSWGYNSAGISGLPLKKYRLKAVKEARQRFEDAIIVATGGIFDGNDAYETFKAGANMIEGFTPYVFYGIGLLRQIERHVDELLKRDETNLQSLKPRLT
ncbi:MAG: hypothetical protein ACP5GD_02755 [Candidatus Micrarchaeia archaeon]